MVSYLYGFSPPHHLPARRCSSFFFFGRRRPCRGRIPVLNSVRVVLLCTWPSRSHLGRRCFVVSQMSTTVTEFRRHSTCPTRYVCQLRCCRGIVSCRVVYRIKHHALSQQSPHKALGVSLCFGRALGSRGKSDASCRVCGCSELSTSTVANTFSPCVVRTCYSLWTKTTWRLACPFRR